jgi:hypothetical protein
MPSRTLHKPRKWIPGGSPLRRRVLIQAFVVHARHATFYLFYAKFPNTYLRDIARYGIEYKQRVAHPIKIQICQSRPYRMRHPQHEADFFRSLSKILYYMVSGYSNVGYLAKDEWNPYYNGIPLVSPLMTMLTL